MIDSGVGGLTVAYELMRQLPNEKLIYLGDTLRCPYGSRPEEEVKQFTFEMVDFLLKKNLKMIVIACNTATAFALGDLQKQLHIPVIGVIKPGSRAAIKATVNEHVGVIGTEGTIQSEAYTAALHNIKATLTVTGLACPTFVPLVESGMVEAEQAEKVVREALIPLKSQSKIDTLILGCTHYPLLEKTIQKVLGPKIKLISSSEETARETSTILEVAELLRTELLTEKHQFYTTGDLEIFERISKTIFNQEVDNLKTVTIEKITLD